MEEISHNPHLTHLLPQQPLDKHSIEFRFWYCNFPNGKTIHTFEQNGANDVNSENAIKFENHLQWPCMNKWKTELYKVLLHMNCSCANWTYTKSKETFCGREKRQREETALNSNKWIRYIIKMCIFYCTSDTKLCTPTMHLNRFEHFHKHFDWNAYCLEWH